MSYTLITGADGHIGQAVARWLLAHADGRLLLYVRARSGQERAAKSALLGDLAKRCRVVFGDLTDDDPFAEVAAQDIDAIIHGAAITNFAVDRHSARAVNIEGTAKLLRFAGECPSLRRFSLISSLYSAGLRNGVIAESPLDEAAQFANHYEWSKWLAERLVCERHDLPWQIIRVATIVGENASGEVVQQNVIHNTLRLLYYGLLAVMPGNPDTRVYLTCTDHVAAAIGRLLDNGDSMRVYHVSNPGRSAVTLGALTDTAYATFLADARFARQRILKPAFCDLEAFNELAGAVDKFGGVTAQALRSVAPFAPQLFSDKDISTAGTDRALGIQQSIDATALLQRVAGHLVETRWGLAQATGDQR